MCFRSVFVTDSHLENGFLHLKQRIIGQFLNVPVIPPDFLHQIILHASRTVDVVESAEYRHDVGQIVTLSQNLRQNSLGKTMQNRRLVGLHDAGAIVANEDHLLCQFPEQRSEHHVRAAACHGECDISSVQFFQKRRELRRQRLLRI